MAYNNVSDATLRKVCKKYGAGSVECESIQHVQQTRVPFECIAECLGLNPEDVKHDLTGTLAMDEQPHRMLHSFIRGILPLGIEKGVLPCRDTALTTSILKLLVVLYKARKVFYTLQQDKQKG